ncbi:MAG: hypothetical protein ACOC0B_02085, partial [bacterium]
MVCVLAVGTHAFGYELGVGTGVDADFDLSGGSGQSFEAYAALRGDGDVRLSPALTLDNTTSLRGGADVETGAGRGRAAAETGLTLRSAPFTLRLANDTVGQLTEDGVDDYLLSDVNANFAWGTTDYSVFFEPGIEWYSGATSDTDRRARTGVSALLRDDMIAEVVAVIGDRSNENRYQMRLEGEAQLDWYTPGPATVGLSTGAGRFVSQDEQQLEGQNLPVWTFTEASAGSQLSFQTSRTSRLGLDVPVTVRWYDHNYVNEDGTLGDATQVVT